VKPADNHPFKTRRRAIAGPNVDDAPAKHPRPDWMLNKDLLPKKPPVGPSTPKDYR
jgi:hypothetical protein